jgi:hypothetical protein
MARAHQVSKSTVQRLGSKNDIKPHLIRTFKISTDPQFKDKFWDVIGLYLHPPDKALVLCCDEKSQYQAIERTQPGLPFGVGPVKTATHDYIRHGTVTLFSALNYLEGKIVSVPAPQHQHQEWLKFLKQIDRETPADLEFHLIADNYATHKHGDLQRWLAKHPLVSHALHPHLRVMAESGGTLLPGSHGRSRTGRQFHTRQGTFQPDSGLPG